MVASTTRTCKTCKKVANKTLFRAYQRCRTAECRECYDLRMAERRKTSAPTDDRAWAAAIKHFYGLTPEKFQEMSDAQGGACAICQEPETSHSPNGYVRRLSIDHCHKTGKVRGLLCAKCNSGLGSFRDIPDLMRVAIDYLELHNG